MYCKNCKWWNQGDVIPLIGYGMCWNNDAADNSPKGSGYTYDISQFHASMWEENGDMIYTGPDFGCVHFAGCEPVNEAMDILQMARG